MCPWLSDESWDVDMIRCVLTECHFALVVANGVQQSHGATGVHHRLLQKVDVWIIHYLVRLLFPESLMLTHTHTHTHNMICIIYKLTTCGIVLQSKHFGSKGARLRSGIL